MKYILFRSENCLDIFIILKLKIVLSCVNETKDMRTIWNIGLRQQYSHKQKHFANPEKKQLIIVDMTGEGQTFGATK